MLETMPSPVTTTRRMEPPSEAFLGGEQADSHVLRLVDRPAVDFHDSVGDAHYQLAHDHPLDLDLVGNLLRRLQNLTGELDLADSERPALAEAAEPTQEESNELPHGVEPEAARHRSEEHTPELQSLMR